MLSRNWESGQGSYEEDKNISKNSTEATILKFNGRELDSLNPAHVKALNPIVFSLVHGTVRRYVFYIQSSELKASVAGLEAVW